MDQNNPPKIQEIADAVNKGTFKEAFLGTLYAHIECEEHGSSSLPVVEGAFKVVDTEYGDIAVPSLSRQELDNLNIRTSEQLNTALKGDTGEVSTSVSKGYSASFAKNYDSIFGSN